ncbi:ABC transporter substrate-binding protein [Massilia aurea]|uniref:substrate-binding periplasmic protein n=1 Tax=Massilia aurea TaxID=373040 RepID=UPI003462A04C
MHSWQLCFALVILSGSLSATTLAASPPVPITAPHLSLTTETAAPSSMLENGRVVGIATDKLRIVLERAGVTYDITLLPWKRAYTAALQQPNACVYSTTRTPERETLFKWIGPTDVGQWVLMGRADRNWRIASLDDARGLRIGTYHGDARDGYLKSRGFVTDAAPSEALNPPKLLQGRIDLWAASWRAGSDVLVKNGWDKEIVPVFVFNRIAVYLACNPAVPDALVKRLNAEFETIERDGTARAIERRYERRASSR